VLGTTRVLVVVSTESLDSVWELDARKVSTVEIVSLVER
jgi:hypothetical protein